MGRKFYIGIVLPLTLLLFVFLTVTRTVHADGAAVTGKGFPFVYAADSGFTSGTLWVAALLLNLACWLALGWAFVFVYRKLFPKGEWQPSGAVRIILQLVSGSVFLWYLAGALLMSKVSGGFCYLDSDFWPAGLLFFGR